MVTNHDGQQIPNSTAAGGGGTLPAATSPAPVNTHEKSYSAIVWAALLVGLLATLVLFVFILQNQQRTTITFLGFEEQLPLGIALIIGAVAGAILVTCFGIVRAIRLSARVRKSRRATTQRRAS